MYIETKMLLKKAFQISKILFFMGPEKYTELLRITKSIRPPTREEINKHIENGLLLEDAIKISLTDRYKSAAKSNGFTEEQGVAMLEYAAILEELKDEDE